MPRQHWRRHGHWRMMRLEHWGVVVLRSCRGNLYQHNWPAGHGAGGCRTWRDHWSRAAAWAGVARGSLV